MPRVAFWKSKINRGAVGLKKRPEVKDAAGPINCPTKPKRKKRAKE